VIVKRAIRNSRTEYEVPDIITWDGFEEFVISTVKALQAEITERHDGPDARCWKVLVDGEIVLFYFDDIGLTWFVPEDRDSLQVALHVEDVLGSIQPPA